MAELTDPVVDLVAALEHNEVGALELLEAHLNRIERLDGDINAVVTIEPERARQEAASIDTARARGESVGPLAGIPITVSW